MKTAEATRRGDVEDRGDKARRGGVDAAMGVLKYQLVDEGSGALKTMGMTKCAVIEDSERGGGES